MGGGGGFNAVAVTKNQDRFEKGWRMLGEWGETYPFSTSREVTLIWLDTCEKGEGI
jgi:hypothetical protein